jgi:hypothetical protein
MPIASPSADGEEPPLPSDKVPDLIRSAFKRADGGTPGICAYGLLSSWLYGRRPWRQNVVKCLASSGKFTCRHLGTYVWRLPAAYPLDSPSRPPRNHRHRKPQCPLDAMIRTNVTKPLTCCINRLTNPRPCRLLSSGARPLPAGRALVRRGRADLAEPARASRPLARSGRGCASAPDPGSAGRSPPGQQPGQQTACQSAGALPALPHAA